MKTITIPKKLVKKGDLVIIPLDEYNKLSALRDKGSFNPTGVQLKALRRAEENFRKGKLLSYNEFKKKLGIEID